MENDDIIADDDTIVLAVDQGLIRSVIGDGWRLFIGTICRQNYYGMPGLTVIVEMMRLWRRERGRTLIHELIVTRRGERWWEYGCLN